jgi:outer membrane protein
MRVRIILAALIGALTLGLAAPAFATQDGWQVRARAIGILPDTGSDLTPALSADVDDAWVPEVDFTYFLSENISFELILATAEHDVSASGIDLGSVWILPPTLMAQYRPNPQGQIQPYVGAGVNYTIFYNEEGTAGFSTDYDDIFGFALQAGADIMIDEHWLFNVDVKKIWLSTDVSVNNGAVVGEVDIDPWVVGIGFGYRF